MQAPPAAVADPVPGEHGVVQAQEQVAQPPAKRRRMIVKGPDPLQQPLAPQPVAAVLPINSVDWTGQTEDSFFRLSHRRRYRWVYDRFARWWKDKKLEFVASDASTCSNELWQLARVNLDVLSRTQKNTIVRHFLALSGPPRWLMPWYLRQWAIVEDDKALPFVLKCRTCLFTYHGDWGVLELGPNVPPNPTHAQLTEHVKEMPEAQEQCGASFKAFAELLAADVRAVYCCCLEICLKTFEEQKELRLHGYLFLKKEISDIRCERARKLRFLDVDPIADRYCGARKSKRQIGQAATIVWPRSKDRSLTMAQSRPSATFQSIPAGCST